MRAALLCVWLWLAPGTILAQILAQVVPSDPWGVVAAYGAAAPFALLCLWMLNRKDKEIETLRGEVSKVTEAGMGQVVPALVRATDQQMEASKVLEAATTQIHQLLARAPDAVMLDRIYRALRDAETRNGRAND